MKAKTGCKVKRAKNLNILNRQKFIMNKYNSHLKKKVKFKAKRQINLNYLIKGTHSQKMRIDWLKTKSKKKVK